MRNNMKKLYFICNLQSGKSMIRNKLAAVVDAFTSAGYEVTVRPTQARMDACAAAEYACLSKQFDLIVCAGGDGTLNEVVQGLMHSQQPLPLGYLPSGSTNDFAKGLRIPDDVEAAAEWILHSHPYHCDIGRFNSRYFLYIAAFGAFTATVYETPQNIKNALGHTAYVLNAIAQVANIRPLHLRIEYDDQVTEGDYLYGMVSNTASVGGLLKLKSFMLDDGSFEVMLIRKPERAMDLHRILTSLLNIDEEIDATHVQFFRANKLRIFSDEKITWTLDGEYGGALDHVEIENLHRAITLCVGEDSIRNDDPIALPLQEDDASDQ